jgi:hypothetical protein
MIKAIEFYENVLEPMLDMIVDMYSLGRIGYEDALRIGMNLGEVNIIDNDVLSERLEDSLYEFERRLK